MAPNVATTFFFYFFAVAALGGALLVITSRNAVHSAVALIVTLFATAGIFLQNGAEFLTGAQVLLYVGGIMLLFVFVIMLVRIEQQVKEPQAGPHWLLGLVAALAVAELLGYSLYAGKGAFVMPRAIRAAFGNMGNSEAVAMTLFGKYLLPFELASLLLLVAMVGAVVMSKKRI
jgi:NADH-quinone oxidoreductase subunit J